MIITPKTTSTLLITSLVLNAFLLGGIATHYAWGHGGRREHHRVHLERRDGPRGPGGDRWGKRGPAEARLLRDVMRALGGPQNPHVREAMSSGRQKMAAHHERMEKAQRDVRAALAAEPYDQAHLTQSLTELQRAAEEGQREAQETLVHLAARLSPEQRAHLRSSAPDDAPPHLQPLPHHGN